MSAQFAALAVLILLGAKGSEPPTAPMPPGMSASSPSSALPSQVFSISEKTEDGSVLKWPDGASVVDVDVNSSVVITLERVAGAGGRTQSTLASDIVEVTQIEERMAGTVRSLAEVSKRRSAFANRTESIAYATIHEAPLAAELLNILDAFETYFARTRSAAEGAALLEVGLGRPGYDGLFELLQDELFSLQARLDASEAQSTATVEIVAWSGGPLNRIHVPGYDDIEGREPQLINKMKFAFDAHFDEETKLARELSSGLKDLNAAKDRLVKALLDRAVAAAKEATEQLKLLEVFEKELALIPMQTGGGTPNAVKDWVDGAKGAAQACRLAAESLTKVSGTNLRGPPVQLLKLVVSDVESAASESTKCIDRLSGLPAPPAIVSVKLKDTIDALKKVVDRVLAQLPTASSRFGLENAKDVSGLKVPLFSALDPTVDLATIERERGDLITIVGRLRQGDTVLAETRRYLRVMPRGFVADVGGVVLYQQGVTFGKNGAPSGSPFTPAAGAYAAIRFTGWRYGDEAGSPLFSLLEPGVALGTVGLTRPDGSTDAGAMMMLHLFGDVVQVGVGYTATQRVFWGVGLGLHRASGLGATLE